MSASIHGYPAFGSQMPPFKVQVRTRGITCAADTSNHISLFHLIAWFDKDF
jgi:hypothetical protein